MFYKNCQSALSCVSFSSSVYTTWDAGTGMFQTYPKIQRVFVCTILLTFLSITVRLKYWILRQDIIVMKSKIPRPRHHFPSFCLLKDWSIPQTLFFFPFAYTIIHHFRLLPKELGFHHRLFLYFSSSVKKWLKSINELMSRFFLFKTLIVPLAKFYWFTPKTHCASSSKWLFLLYWCILV